MALLDVSELLLDPDLTDTFTVRRRTQVVSPQGRTTTSDQNFPGIIGVVTATSPNGLARGEDYQVQPRAITVVTQFRVRGEQTGYQPDIIIWRGSHYVVTAIDQYPHFGRGFVQVECESMDKTDGPLDMPAPGGLSFNQAANAAYLPGVL